MSQIEQLELEISQLKETVKKLHWKPDVVHVMGWMSSLVPLYLKKYYSDDWVNNLVTDVKLKS